MVTPTTVYTATPVKDVSGGGKREFIKIDHKERKLRGSVRTVTYLDADTQMWVAYTAALELSGYASQKEDAKKMLRDSIDDFFVLLVSLPEYQAAQQLFALGWVRDRFFKKEFSSAHVDEKGRLQGVNIQEGTLERSALATAA